jgi:retron-type reverse transcriptase
MMKTVVHCLCCGVPVSALRSATGRIRIRTRTTAPTYVLLKQCRPCRQRKKRQNQTALWYPRGKRAFETKAMKRIGNLYEKIISIENLQLAEAKAQQGKSKQYGVRLHNKNREANIQALHEMLKNKTYRTSKYDIFKVYEPKEREIYRLPFFPDRIAHHAIMNVLEPIFVSTFTTDSYSCIKGKGIHAAANALKKALKNKQETTYCLKMDITKFYPNIDHDVLKSLLRRKFKDPDLLWLLDEIIDSATGIPIGNYLSQYFANFYLTYFDHWLKEDKRVKHYFRYADDLIILAANKPYLHALLAAIKTYLNGNLKLKVKGNYQIFPVEARGIDFVGYRFYHTHTLLRKSIKQNFARMVKKRPSKASIASYKGWAKHCDSKHLVKKLLPNE